MTAKPKTVTVATSVKPASVSIPKRQVIQHTKLFKAELNVALQSANNALAAADLALTAAAGERDMAIELANQRFAAIRSELDDERIDALTKITGIEAAMAAMEPEKPALSVVTTAAAQ